MEIQKTLDFDFRLVWAASSGQTLLPLKWSIESGDFGKFWLTAVFSLES